MTRVLMALAMVVVMIQPMVEQAHGALAATRLDWGSKPPMPTARQQLVVAAAPNGKLYAFGGNLDGTLAGTIGTFEEYDPATNVWTPKAPRIIGRQEAGMAVATNGKLYVVGGSLGAIPT